MPLNPRLRTVSPSPLFVAGVLLFLVGAVPFFSFVVMELMGSELTRSHPNPVGFGFLLWVAGFPGFALMFLGMGRWLSGKRW